MQQKQFQVKVFTDLNQVTIHRYKTLENAYTNFKFEMLCAGRSVELLITTQNTVLCLASYDHKTGEVFQ